MVVNDFLVEHFPEVVDLNFTATVEEEFDEIAEGRLNWREMIKRFYKPFHADITKALEEAPKATGARLLGVDPASGRNVYSRIGRFGPMVQIGEVSDEEKPRFASLRKDQSIATITYEEAMDLFKLPREVGEHEGEKVIIGVGRYGPYVKIGTTYASLQAEDDPLSIELPRALELMALKKSGNAIRELGEYEGELLKIARGRFGPYVKFKSLYASIPKNEDLNAVTLERAIELIKAKQEVEAAQVIKTFDGTELQILKGRYGPYITDGKKIANVPKDRQAEELTQEECEKMIAEAPERKGKGRGGFRRKKN
jgi:DNA topoisomerase-1